jgi:hypothetical protein
MISPAAMVISSPRPAPSAIPAKNILASTAPLNSPGKLVIRDLTGLIPSPSPKRTSPTPAARVPAQGPFALTSLSLSLPSLPEDYDLGPLQADPSAQTPGSALPPRSASEAASKDPALVAYSFLSALKSKKGLEAFYATGRKAALSQSLRPYLNGASKAAAFRLGALKTTADTAQAVAFLYGQKGERVLAELFLTKTDGSWKIDGLTVDFAELDSGVRAKAQRFAPQEYRLFSY